MLTEHCLSVNAAYQQSGFFGKAKHRRYARLAQDRQSTPSFDTELPLTCPLCVHDVVERLERVAVLSIIKHAIGYDEDKLPSIAMAPRTHDIIFLTKQIEIIGPQPRKGEGFLL